MLTIAEMNQEGVPVVTRTDPKQCSTIIALISASA
jgi:hypothetical protein